MSVAPAYIFLYPISDIGCCCADPDLDLDRALFTAIHISIPFLCRIGETRFMSLAIGTAAFGL